MEYLQNLFTWQIVAIGIVGITLIYTLFIKPKLVVNKSLTTEQLAEIDKIIARGLVYAQNLYASNSEVDVKAITLEYVLAEVRLSKIIPDEYFSFVEVVVNNKIK